MPRKSIKNIKNDLSSVIMGHPLEWIRVEMFMNVSSVWGILEHQFSEYRLQIRDLYRIRFH